MSIVSITCFLIASGLLLTCLRRGSDIFSPGRVFGFVWAIAIGLADLKLSRLQHVWEGYAWLTLTAGLVSFLLGVFAIHVIFANDKIYSIRKIRENINRQIISERRLFFVILMLFLLYLLAYLIEWSHLGVLPLFAKDPVRARGEFPLFGLHLLVNSMPAILFLIFQYIVWIKNNNRNKIFLAGIFVLTFVSSFLLLNRLFFDLFLLMVCVSTYYGTNLFRFRNLAISVPAFVGVMAYLQEFREIQYAKGFLYIVSDMKYSPTFAALTGPYMYIVMNLENFSRAVIKLQDSSYGLFSFDFFFALTGLKHWLSDYFHLQEGRFLISGYNTFPFLWDYYYDFGFLGLLIMPFMLGFVVSLIHKQLRQNPNRRTMTYYALAMFVVVFSFFSHLLALLNFVFNIVLIVIAQRVITKVDKGATRTI